MPNVLNEYGLTIKTKQEVIDLIVNGDAETAGLKSIYGNDINVDSNSPDGQLVGVLAQVAVDNLELVAQVNAAMDPDLAVGSILDQRCAINGVFRLGATYTSVMITITVDRTVALVGLDTGEATAFTIADSAGTKYYLVEGDTFTTGAHTVEFRSAEAGANNPAPNTITSMQSVIAGVVSVTNAAAAFTVGRDKESDDSLRSRRQRSVSLPSNGFLAGMTAGLLNTAGVTDAIVYENITNADDVDGVPAHGIWCIVDGGADQDVGNSIYVKRNAGVGMKGDEEVAITQVNGLQAIVKFDRSEAEDLYIDLAISTIYGGATADADYIRQQLLARLSYGIYEPAEVTYIVSLIKWVDPTLVVTGEGVGTNGTDWDDIVYPTTKKNRFVLASTRIRINGAYGS